jgi:hypothetical protein
MEQRAWKMVCRAIRSADRRVPRLGRRKRFSDALIVRMYFWAVDHDRPMYWACDRMHPTGLPWRRFPAPVLRRLFTGECGRGEGVDGEMSKSQNVERTPA